MLNALLLVAIVGALWLYSRCCLAAHVSDSDLYIDEVELRYADVIGASPQAQPDLRTTTRTTHRSLAAPIEQRGC